MARMITLLCLLTLLFPVVTEAQQKPSVDWVSAIHYTRDNNRPIRYIVIHTVEGSYRGCISWFRNPRSKVSAHYVVSLDGEITQMVRDKDRAWHAGSSQFNREAIGIEHEGFAHKNTWTDAQYRASAQLTRYLCLRYNIPMSKTNIISHQSIAPRRRSDPGPYFDWDYYIKLVKGENASRTMSPETAENRGRSYAAAERAMNNGNHREAYRRYRDLARNYPESRTSTLSQERLNLYKEKFRELDKLLKELAVEMEKANHLIALERAKELMKKGRYEEAEFIAEKNLATAPKGPYADQFRDLLKDIKEKKKKAAKGKGNKKKKGAIGKLRDLLK